MPASRASPSPDLPFACTAGMCNTKTGPECCASPKSCKFAGNFGVCCTTGENRPHLHTLPCQNACLWDAPRLVFRSPGRVCNCPCQMCSCAPRTLLLHINVQGLPGARQHAVTHSHPLLLSPYCPAAAFVGNKCCSGATPLACESGCTSSCPKCALHLPEAPTACCTLSPIDATVPLPPRYDALPQPMPLQRSRAPTAQRSVVRPLPTYAMRMTRATMPAAPQARVLAGAFLGRGRCVLGCCWSVASHCQMHASIIFWDEPNCL